LGIAPNTNERSSPPSGDAPLRTAEAKPKPAKVAKVKLPELDPVDPERDEPIVIPAAAEKSKPEKRKNEKHRAEKPRKEPTAKRRADARAKSVPKRSGKKPASQDFRRHG